MHLDSGKTLSGREEWEKKDEEVGAMASLMNDLFMRQHTIKAELTYILAG